MVTTEVTHGGLALSLRTGAPCSFRQQNHSCSSGMTAKLYNDHVTGPYMSWPQFSADSRLPDGPAKPDACTTRAAMNRVPRMTRSSGLRLRSHGFHFGFQPRVTQEHLPLLSGSAICPKCLFWVSVGYAGFKLARTENPRVGGSIPPLATIKSNC